MTTKCPACGSTNVRPFKGRDDMSCEHRCNSYEVPWKCNVCRKVFKIKGQF